MATVAKDYTGVSTRELGEIFDAHLDVDAEIFADRIGMDLRELKRIVVTQSYQWVGLDKADRICLGLGLTIGALTECGDLTVVPAWGEQAAKKMAQDEFWVADETPTAKQLAKRTKELAKLRGFVLGPLTPEQQAHRLADQERAAKKVKK